MESVRVAAATPPPALDPDFPEPASLRSAVSFWMRVYLEVTTDGGLLHDSSRLGVVYETVRFDGEQNSRRRQRMVDKRRNHWRTALRRLSRGGTPRDEQERTVLRLLEEELGHPPTPSDLAVVARRVRFQLGQRDKFRAGIIRSGAYEDAMRATFRREKLPEDLAYLPHVESSFNPAAYSKYGAAGVWQFMRATGRRFMTVDYTVDERLDPMTSTRAAARLLKENHKVLRSWPLAITAYNHGTSGMRRAVRRLGTDDIGVIARKYHSRRFGFASRNFYAQFLAARKILKAYEPYFGPLVRNVPEAADEITLPFYADVKDLRTHAGVAPEVVKHYNPTLRPPIYRSAKRIPKGYVLRLPAGTLGPDPEKWLASIPEGKRHAKQRRSNYYQVRRGDTLSQIARRHGTSVSTLVAFNSLPSRHRIYPGQVLQMPDPGQSPRRRRSGLIKTAQAAPKQRPAAPARPLPVAKDAITPLSGPTPEISSDSPWRRVNGDWIIVDALETLGHFAEWLEVPTQRLRDRNGIAYGRALQMGERLELDFSKVTPQRFLERRMEYHKGIEEDFFGSYEVTGTISHRLRNGESIWELSHKTYGVPSWLIRRYNEDVDLTKLVPGKTLLIPAVKPLGSS